MKPAFEVLERRNSSARPPFVAQEILNSDLAVSLLDYGDL